MPRRRLISHGMGQEKKGQMINVQLKTIKFCLRTFWNAQTLDYAQTFVLLFAVVEVVCEATLRRCVIPGIGEWKKSFFLSKLTGEMSIKNSLFDELQLFPRLNFCGILLQLQLEFFHAGGGLVGSWLFQSEGKRNKMKIKFAIRRKPILTIKFEIRAGPNCKAKSEWNEFLPASFTHPLTHTHQLWHFKMSFCKTNHLSLWLLFPIHMRHLSPFFLGCHAIQFSLHLAWLLFLPHLKWVSWQ